MAFGGKPALNALKQHAEKICKLLEERGTVPRDELGGILAEEVLAESRREAESKAEMRMIEEEGGTLFELEEDRSHPQKKLKTMETNTDKEKVEPEAKSIHRRVYDAINVLEALGILVKDRNMVTWRGKRVRPKGGHQVRKLERYQEMCRRHDEKVKSLAVKRQHLQDKLEEVITNHNLYRSNYKKQQKALNLFVPLEENINGIRAESMNKEDRVPLPFVVAGASNRAIIKCNVSEEHSGVEFDFSLPFEVIRDRVILKRLNIGRTTAKDLSKILPVKLLKFALKNQLLDHLIVRQNPCRLLHSFSPIQAPAGMFQVPTVLDTDASKLQPKVQQWIPSKSAKTKRPREHLCRHPPAIVLPAAMNLSSRYPNLMVLPPNTPHTQSRAASSDQKKSGTSLVSPQTPPFCLSPLHHSSSTGGAAPIPMYHSPSVGPGIYVSIASETDTEAEKPGLHLVSPDLPPLNNKRTRPIS